MYLSMEGGGGGRGQVRTIRTRELDN
jgi:hypothetical protein